jgi:hypothetical protein
LTGTGLVDPHCRAVPKCDRSTVQGAVRAVRVFALASLVLAAARPARAQEAVWVASPAEQRQRWYAAARGALEAEGVLVSEAGEGGDRCAPAQAREAARARGATRGLCLEVEHDGEHATAVTVELAGEQGAAERGRAEVERADAAAATRAAYRSALLALELGDSGLLRVRTTPEGAVVAFDGEPGGHAPLERRLAPGAHRVALSLDGFAPHQQDVQVARGRVLELDVQLERASGGEPLARRERSPINYIVGGALLVGAAPLLAISLVALARDGDCVERSGGVCTERVRFGARSAILLGAGAAALAAGTYLVLAAPIEVEVRADADGAGVSLGGRF